MGSLHQRVLHVPLQRAIHRENCLIFSRYSPLSSFGYQALIKKTAPDVVRDMAAFKSRSAAQMKASKKVYALFRSYPENRHNALRLQIGELPVVPVVYRDVEEEEDDEEEDDEEDDDHEVMVEHHEFSDNDGDDQM